MGILGTVILVMGILVMAILVMGILGTVILGTVILGIIIKTVGDTLQLNHPAARHHSDFQILQSSQPNMPHHS